MVALRPATATPGEIVETLSALVSPVPRLDSSPDAPPEPCTLSAMVAAVTVTDDPPVEPAAQASSALLSHVRLRGPLQLQAGPAAGDGANPEPCALLGSGPGTTKPAGPSQGKASQDRLEDSDVVAQTFVCTRMGCGAVFADHSSLLSHKLSCSAVYHLLY
jgi:hypothetical protein